MAGVPPAGRVALALLLALSVAPTAGAQDLAAAGRELTDIAADASRVTRQRIRSGKFKSPTHVEERLTDGQLFYNLQDYVRASIIFTDIVENYPNHRAYPDALWLLGDSLFRAGDYFGSRNRFRQVLDGASRPGFGPHVQRALGRLIEIAIHTRDFDGVEEYFQQLSRLPPQEVEATTTYFRAKYLYNRAVPTEDILREGPDGSTAPSAQVDLSSLDRARETFMAVPSGSPYYLQSRYFVGVVHTLRGEYPQAIEAFRRVLRAKATTPEHTEVIELAHLALGRLYYETDQLDQSIAAYQKVPRTSKRFDTALYEVAWAYIRLGDSTRAERALEVLAVAAPDSRHIPDGKLLRGNLLLRNGRFKDANKVFREVRNQFGPVYRELDELIKGRDGGDPQAYFRQLVRENLDAFDANAFLPEEARRWTVLNDDLERALRALGDLSKARQLVRETGDLIDRLNGAIHAPNQVSVFPDLRRHREATTALRNRLAKVRQVAIKAEERSLKNATGELRDVRERRRGIERVPGGMPTSGDDFVMRDDQLLGRYRGLERRLSELEVELMGMEARVTATDRFMTDAGDSLQMDEAGRTGIRRELDQQRDAVEEYRRRVAELDKLIEIGRIQVGVGDARYARDDRLRDEYNDLVEREHQLMAAAGVRRSGEVDRMFGRISEVEALLDTHDARVDKEVEERVTAMAEVINEEAENLAGYRTALAGLEDETEEVIGVVTYNNYKQIRERFYDLVLRADVGRIDVAWAEREEHRMRVDMLTRERAREIQALDDEFREIRDEADGQNSQGGAQ